MSGIRSHSIHGTVKAWFAGGGYGFIAPDAPGARDVFVGIRNLELSGIGSLTTGDRLVFAVEERNGKPQAVAIARV